MSDAEQKLLREMLQSAYRDVNPELSDRGAHLVKKLAEGLYARGARILIGTPEPSHSVYIHQSADPLGNLVWTCRRWNNTMGYASQAAIGRHVAEFVDDASYEMLKGHVWPELARSGKIEDVPIILITSTRETLRATLKSEMLRDEKGAFLRTFTKLKVRIPAALARLAGASCLLLAAG